MQVITVFNEKGGVGKTTLTGIIGAGLALRGHRVLLIDADGQGDLTTNMALKPTSHFYDFVKRGDPAEENYVPVGKLLRRVPQDNCPKRLYIVAGNNETWGIPQSTSLPGLVANIARRLHDLERAFDYVVIDTQPSATMLHDALGLVTDWFICPTDPEPLSAYGGLRSTLAHIAHIREQSKARGRDKAKLLGIVPNKFRVSTSLHQFIYEKLREQYGECVFAPLPLRTSIPESQFRQTTLMHDAPDLETNRHLWAIVDRVLMGIQGEVR